MIDLMVDSGAFSAWRSGRSIDLPEYCDFVRALEAPHCVNLDVIPGDFGRKPTAQEVEASAQQGWDNYDRILARGLNPIPVFHQHERMEWLHRMLDSKIPYIGISPANDVNTNQKREWLDRVFRDLTVDGRPVVRTHGFGMTSFPLMTRYPWTTCDSLSWLFYAVYGLVLFDHIKRDGTFLVESTAVSDRVKSYLQRGNHLDTKPPEYIKLLVAHARKENIKLENVRRSTWARAVLNIRVYQRFERHRREITPSQPTQPQGLFTTERVVRQPVTHSPPFSVVFADNLEAGADQILFRTQTMRRLLSFWMVKTRQNQRKPKDRNIADLRRYLESDGRYHWSKGGVDLGEGGWMRG